MHKIFLLAAAIAFASCKTTTYYVVRHAEKEAAANASDVALSAAGRHRADALRAALKMKSINAIYSTNFLRTRSTAQPVATDKALNIQNYDPRDTGFISNLRTENKNVLIVGHSNTVDDIVNRLAGKKAIPGDLPDSQYGDLFVVKKKGRRYTFTQKHFGN